MYQKPHQRNGIIVAYFSVAVTVGIFLCCICQRNNTGTSLIQQNRIDNIYPAVQIDITQHGLFRSSCIRWYLKCDRTDPIAVHKQA